MSYYEEQNKCRQTFEATIKEAKLRKVPALLIKPFEMELLNKFAVGEKFVNGLFLKYSEYLNYKIKGGFLVFNYTLEEEEAENEAKALAEVEALKRNIKPLEE